MPHLFKACSHTFIAAMGVRIVIRFTISLQIKRRFSLVAGMSDKTAKRDVMRPCENEAGQLSTTGK